MGQRRDRAVLVGRHEQAGLEQNLKAVADAEDEPFGIAEAAQRVAEKVGELIGQDLARRHVIAVGEAAGDGEDLVAHQLGRLLAQAVDVDALGDRAGLLEGELGFGVAVGAGGSQNQDARGGHAQVITGQGRTFRLTGRKDRRIIVLYESNAPNASATGGNPVSRRPASKTRPGGRRREPFPFFFSQSPLTVFSNRLYFTLSY